MAIYETIRNLIMALFHSTYHILWGDLIRIPLPGGSFLGLSLLILILILLFKDGEDEEMLIALGLMLIL